MKPYFTQFLFVEGSPKVGGYVYDLFGGGISKVVNVDGKGVATEHGYSSDWEKGYRSVELSFCTKKAEVGEEVMYTKFDGTQYSKAKVERVADRLVTLNAEGIGTFVTSHDLITKVLGVVSTGAHWVKEKMEFGDDDWRFMITDDEGKTKRVVEIRCPYCNQYH